MSKNELERVMQIQEDIYKVLMLNGLSYGSIIKVLDDVKKRVVQEHREQMENARF